MRKTLRLPAIALSGLLALGLAASAPVHAQQMGNAAPASAGSTIVIGTGITLSSDWSNQTVTFFTNGTANDDGESWSHFYDVNTVIGDDKPYRADWIHSFASGKGSHDSTYRWRRDAYQSETRTMDKYLAAHGIPTWQLQLQHADDPNKVGPNDVKHVKIRLASPDGRFQLVITATYVNEDDFNLWVGYTADFLGSLSEGALEDGVRTGNLPLFMNTTSTDVQVAFADGRKVSDAADTFVPITTPTTPTGQALPSPLGNVSATGGS